MTEPDPRDSHGRVIYGIVMEILPHETYRLKLENEGEVIGHPAGATVTNFVRLRPGDRVELELSPYDRSRGRILKKLASKAETI